MLQYNPTVTGSLQVSGDITGTFNGINITGLSQSVSSQLINVQVSTGSSDAKFETLSGVTSSALTRLTNIESKSASVDTSISNINSITSSFSPRVSNLESKSSSVDISISNINSVTASNIARLSNLETKSSSVDISISNINSFTSSNDTKFTTLGTYTGSLDTKNTTLADVTSSLISKTGSYATTGSNQFYGTQVFSGSVYIANDLVVQGSSSIQYISASSVSIGTNIVQLNTANPSVRFAGLTIIDSGSIGGSGSFLYDSVHDEFVFVHRGNGTNVTSSHFVLGPETYDSLGNETYLTCNVLTKGTGKEHLVDSCIFDDGTTTCIKNNLVGTGTITGTTIYGSTITCSPIGCFATSCATSFIGGTLSGTTIYGSTAVCSAVGKFTSCIDAGTGTFSGNLLNTNSNFQTYGSASFGVSTWGLSIGNGNASANYYRANDHYFQNGAGTQTLQIASTGAATFSSTITGTTIYGSTAVCSPIGLFSGCVGIGTASPSYKLEIYRGSSGVVLNLQGVDAYDAETGILFTSSRAKISGFLNSGGGTPGSSLRFYTMPDGGSVTERLRINSDGISCFAATVCSPTFKGGSFNGTTGYFSCHIELNDNGMGWIYGYDKNHSIIMRGDRNACPSDYTNYYQYGGNLSTCKGHNFWTDGVLASQTIKMQIANNGICMTVPLYVCANGSAFGTASTTGPTMTIQAGSNCRAIIFKNAGGADGSLWLYGTSNTINYSFSTYSVGDAFVLYNNGTYDFAGGDASDIRLKENITTIDYNATEKLMQLVSKSYNMIKHPDTKRSGFIAQEVKEVLPDFVTGEETEKDYLGIDYNGILSLAVKAIQEQQCTINLLKSCIGIS